MRLSSCAFTFDGINSEDKNLIQTPNQRGLYSELLNGDVTIREVKIEGRDETYFYNTQRQPLEFSLTFSVLEGVLTEAEIRDIQDWLFQDTYKPLIFSENPDVIYYVIFDRGSTFSHNGLRQGYFNVNVKCNAPYGYTALTTTPTTVIGGSPPPTGTDIQITNNGSRAVRPNIFIDKVSGDGVVRIENINNGSVFEYDFNGGELYEVDGKNRIFIEVSSGDPLSPDAYWLLLDSGVNDIKITGSNVEIYFEYSAPLYIG